MFSFFKGWRNISTNVTQILLVAILLPFVAIVVSIFNPSSGGEQFSSMTLSLFAEIPLFKAVFDVMTTYIDNVSGADLTNITLSVFFKAFPDAILVGICIHICTELFNINWNPLKEKHKSFRPLPIFPAFLGIIVSTIVSGLISLAGNVIIELIAELGVIIIMIFAFRRIFGSFRKPIKLFSVGKILLLIIEGIYSIIIVVYVTGLAMVSAGMTGDSANTVKFLTTIVVCTVLASLIVYFVSYFSRNDNYT